MICDFVKHGDDYICACGAKIPIKIAGDRPYAKCNRRCKNVDKVTNRNGVSIKVKCGCKGNKEVDQYYPVYKCKIYNRCLPTLVLHGDQLEKWNQRKPESDIYHLCQNCEQYEPRANP